MPNAPSGIQETVEMLKKFAEGHPLASTFLPDPSDFSNMVNPLGTTITKGSIPALRALAKVFTKKTDMPFYDNMIDNPKYFEHAKGLVRKRVLMSPSDYMQQAFKYPSMAEEGAIWSKVDRYFEEMKTLLYGGKEPARKFPTPTIEKRSYGVEQEGRHRALAAKKLGFEKIPTWIINEVD